jgi:hypothetical protein
VAAIVIVVPHPPALAGTELVKASSLQKLFPAGFKLAVD